MTIRITCPFCNFSKEMPEEKIPRGVKWANCPRCKHRFEFSYGDSVFGFQGEPAGAETTPKRGVSPWERRSELGIWKGLYETFKGVLFSPGNLFSTMTHKGGIGEPLAFGLLLGSLGIMFGVFWQFLMMGDRLVSSWPNVMGQFGPGLIFFILMVLTPLYVLISLFVISGILHLCLLIVGAGRNGFEATFRIIAFSQSVNLLGLVPFVGGVIGWCWQIIVQVIGLREMHETTYLRTIFAMLLPVVLFVILFIVTMILVFSFLKV